MRDDGRVAGGGGCGRTVRVRRRAVAALVAGLATAVLTACGSASEPSPPSGVDELVIPTPSVDPRDFVDRVDNRWLPLEPGARWTYRVTGPSEGTLTVSVRAETAPVAGVRATVVDTTGPLGDSTDYYAQDRSGNVWWLGRHGVWQAGVDGAEAGLAMPEAPRLGDGWREAYLAGVVEDRAEVTSVQGEASVPAGDLDGLVQIETRSHLDPGGATERSYAAGVGLVRTASLEGTVLSVELVSGP